MKVNNVFLEIFDSLFIMILCFGTLLTAMLLKGDTAGTLKYSISFDSFIITITGFVICLTFILKNSEKGLRHMVEQLYIDQESTALDYKSSIK